MKILLRHLETGFYLRSPRPGAWTELRADAQDLGDHERAIRLARELRLRHAELLLVFGNPEFDVRLPLRFDPGFRPGLPQRS
jgi:hypothetical protein